MLVSAVATARVSSAVMNDATATTRSTRLRTTSEMSMPTDVRERRFSTGRREEFSRAHSYVSKATFGTESVLKVALLTSPVDRAGHLRQAPLQEALLLTRRG